MHTYEPKPGSVPARAIALMQADPREWTTKELAEAVNVGQTSLHGRLDDALRAGLVRKDTRGVDGQYITLWSAGDGTPPEQQAAAGAGEEPAAFECALWNDGSLSISCGSLNGVLPPEQAEELATYLARTWSPRPAASEQR